MPYLVFPLQVSSQTATVWLGAINENFDPTRLSLIVNGLPTPLPAPWQQWRSEGQDQRVDFQRLELTNRQPNTVYDIELRVNGTMQSSAKVTTLPLQLPRESDPKPFTVMLGSCYFEPNDNGRAGAVFRSLPTAAKPDVKLLCGDQVYLDNPWYQTLNLFPQSQNNLEKNFLKKYLRNWMQTQVGEGYREVLATGANFFCADDHEYWNNFPTAASYVVGTWTDNGRERWHAATEPLYNLFQTPEKTQRFTVGNLSFFIADTRSARDNDRQNFMDPAQFAQLEQWVNGLTGPGVLVLGQVIFAGKANEVGGRLGDWGLPDFAQYEALVRVLLSAQHSLLVLTGDVHFGRVARCTLVSGAELIEVISSPMSLVSDLGGGAAPPPQQFPAFPVPNAVSVNIEQQPDRLFLLEGNHFATVSFVARGAKVIATIKYWMIGNDPNVRISHTLPEIQLQ